MSEKKVIEIKIGQIMKQRRLLIKEVAEGTGLNFNTVSSYYNNKIRMVKLDVIDRFCSYLDVPLTEVLVRPEDKKAI
jgi:DNA-binding Xre family transcriptional regulator